MPTETIPDTAVVRGYDFNKGCDINGLMESMLTTGFQATTFGQAIAEVNRMVRGGHDRVAATEQLSGRLAPGQSLLLRNSHPRPLFPGGPCRLAWPLGMLGRQTNHSERAPALVWHSAGYPCLRGAAAAPCYIAAILISHRPNSVSGR